MSTYHTLTGSLGTIVGTNPRSPSVTIRTNMPAGEALVDLDNNKVLLRGATPVELSNNLTFEVTLLDLNAAGTNITDGTGRYIVDVQWYEPNGNLLTWSSGAFEMTADADLSDKAGSAGALPAVPAPAPALIDAATASNINTPGSQTNDALNEVLGPLRDIAPNGIIEGRALFQYGPSRGVGVTAQRVHFNRLRRRLGSGFYFNASVGGHQAADTVSLMYGAIATTSRQGGAENEWAPTIGPSTFVNAAVQAGFLLWWPFGNDALHDGRPDRNSTTVKARASAKTALHAGIALARAETRIESTLVGTGYTTTNGSPNVTAQLASAWYRGALVTGPGIPANTYVGDLINNGLGGFKLSSSRTAQVDVNATATAAGVTIVFSPVYGGVWSTTDGNPAFSGSAIVKTVANGATSTYVITLPNARRVHWITAAIDDAEYAGTKAAPYGGTGGAGYSIVVDGGAPIVGTTSNQHRFGALDLCHSQMAVDLGTLGAGSHTITITSVGANKLLVDDGLIVESRTPLTVQLMKEVELPAAYYALLPTYGASWAKTQIYNQFLVDELAQWPNDQSVRVHDIAADGWYDKAVHISARDGAYAHFTDEAEARITDSLMADWNTLAPRPGLVYPTTV